MRMRMRMWMRNTEVDADGGGWWGERKSNTLVWVDAYCTYPHARGIVVVVESCAATLCVALTV